jgi:hypothetical protein
MITDDDHLSGRFAVATFLVPLRCRLLQSGFRPMDHPPRIQAHKQVQDSPV